MGRLLYAEAARQIPDFPPIRVYAPVGEHKDLLAYLVRRLLENGANTSFVNRFMDEQVAGGGYRSRSDLGTRTARESAPSASCPIRLPCMPNGAIHVGIDVGNPPDLAAVRVGVAARRSSDHVAGPIINGVLVEGRPRAITNPADNRDCVGSSRDATPAEIVDAFDRSSRAQAAWNGLGGALRADCLDRAAELLEKGRLDFYALLVREGGQNAAGCDCRSA